jgi:hypothetical protein
VNGVECRTPFANNQVPLTRSVVAQKVLALIPLPNYTGAGTSNNVSWQKGQHSVCIGGSYRWTEFSYENNGPAAECERTGCAEQPGRRLPV